MAKTFYIIDTSSLIELNRHNPIDIFPTLWKKIDNLINSDLLISHKEVFNEVFQQDDQLSEWCKKNKKMFRDITSRQTQLVSEILKKYPSLIKIDRKYDADPWLIALAREIKESPQQTLFEVKRLIVTEETLRGDKIKIPFVCQEFEIECINRIQMFREEKWQF